MNRQLVLASLIPRVNVRKKLQLMYCPDLGARKAEALNGICVPSNDHTYGGRKSPCHDKRWTTWGSRAALESGHRHWTIHDRVNINQMTHHLMSRYDT